MNRTEKPIKIHQGHNVKRLREMQGIKQTTLAYELGDTWTQKKISELEAKETIETNLLEQVAKILHVTPETIQNLDEESAVNIISNSFTDFKDNSNASAMNYSCEFNFNPIEKVIELYERLLQSERDKVELLKGKS